MIMAKWMIGSVQGSPAARAGPTVVADRDRLYRDPAAATQHYVTGQTTTSTLNTDENSKQV